MKDKTVAETLIRNIESRMNYLNMSINDLGKRSGVSSRMIRYILEGTSAVSVPKLEKIAKGLNIPVPDLFQNSINENRTAYPSMVLIPVIDYVQAGEWGDVNDPFEKGFGHEMIYSEPRNSESCFALLVDGHSMTAPKGSEDSFPHGTYVHIDPTKKAENGSFVVAKRKNQDKATFKQLRYNEGEPYLQALNPDYPSIFDEFEIVGTLYLSSKKY